jgi:hypothetical protein
MSVGNKSYIFDIQNSIFTTPEVDPAYQPPPSKILLNFVPKALLKALPMKYKSYKVNYTISNDTSIYCVSAIICAKYRAWY